MKDIALLALVAFISFAEGDIMSDMYQYGKVDNIHVDAHLIEDLSNTLNTIPYDSLAVPNVGDIVGVANSVANIAFSPIKEQSDRVCAQAEDMAKTFFSDNR